MIFRRKRIYGINKDADAARLAHIVAACNAYVARGQRIGIVLGHTPGADYHDTLCLDVGAEVPSKDFYTDGLWVYATLETDPVFDEVVKRHPLVSVELFSDGVICPIAFMASNRPAIEVGPLEFDKALPGVDLAKYAYTEQRDGEHSTFSQTEENPDMLTEEAVKNMISECLLSSDMAGQIKSLTDTVGQLQIQVQNHSEQAEKLAYIFDDEEEAGESAPEVGGEPAAPTGEGAPEETGGEAKQPTGEAAPEVEKNDQGGGMAMASGSNTMIPSTDTKPDEEKMNKKNYEELELESQTYMLEAENAKKIAADYASRIEAIGSAAEAAKAQAAELVQKYAMERRRNDLLVLHDKYEFDVDKEMEIVTVMDDAQFEQHKTQVVTKYAAPPVHSAPVSVGELPVPVAEGAPAERIIPKDVMAKVVGYATKNKITDFKKAYKECMGCDPP
jgi:hypothetical protein